MEVMAFEKYVDLWRSRLERADDMDRPFMQFTYDAILNDVEIIKALSQAGKSQQAA